MAGPFSLKKGKSLDGLRADSQRAEEEEEETHLYIIVCVWTAGYIYTCIERGLHLESYTYRKGINACLAPSLYIVWLLLLLLLVPTVL